MHQVPLKGDILFSDAPSFVGKVIMAGTESEAGHVGLVVSDLAADGTVVTHEGFPGWGKSDGITVRSRTLGEPHIGYVTVARTEEERRILIAASSKVVAENVGYGWGEIALIALHALTGWLVLFHLGPVARLLIRFIEWVSARLEERGRRICSNHVAVCLHALWEHRAALGDEVAQYMLDSEVLRPERQWPGYCTKRLRLALRLYEQQASA